MPKKKLSDINNSESNVDQPSGASSSGDDAPEAGATTPVESGEAEGTTSSSESDDEPADEAEPDDTAGDPEPESESNAVEVSAEKTLDDFRAAFGREQGSVFFADQTPFVDACVAHMETLNATIKAQSEEIEQLKAQNADLAKEVHGEADPLDIQSSELSSEQKTRAENMGDAKAAYAEGLKPTK